MYRLHDRPPTPAATLETAREIGLQAGLKYVYLGNLRSRAGEDTPCPGCGKPLIERHGFTVLVNRVHRGGCPDCGAAVAGVGLDAAAAGK